MVTIGLLADLHGDLAGFQAAVEILRREQAAHLLCPGDIADRGADADEIVRLLQAYGVICVKGNHDQTVVHFQERWRTRENQERLTELGRIISDETVAYLRELPEQTALELAGVRVLMGHGTPWSDILGVFPDSRPALFHQLLVRYGSSTDALILGHTHEPMEAQVGTLRIFNPGSVYGVTIRDSHTCAVLELPGYHFKVYDVRTGQQIEHKKAVIEL